MQILSYEVSTFRGQGQSGWNDLATRLEEQPRPAPDDPQSATQTAQEEDVSISRDTTIHRFDSSSSITAALCCLLRDDASPLVERELEER